MDPKLDFRLRSLIYLIEVVNAGSQKGAGDKLGVTQSALSQSIETLEKDWGMEIFEVDGKRRVLTEAGKALLKYASSVIGQTIETKAWLDSLAHGKLGVLRVGMIDSANLYILPKALTEFHKAFTNVELNIVVESSDPLFEKLSNFELDLAFMTYSPVSEQDFKVEEIFTEDLFLFSPKKLNPKTGPWALYPTRSRTRQVIDIGLHQEGIDPDVIMESANPKVLSQMVKLGFCNSILPLKEANPDIASLKCHKVAERKLVALTRKTSPTDIRAKALIDLAKDS